MNKFAEYYNKLSDVEKERIIKMSSELRVSLSKYFNDDFSAEYNDLLGYIGYNLTEMSRMAKGYK